MRALVISGLVATAYASLWGASSTGASTPDDTPTAAPYLQYSTDAHDLTPGDTPAESPQPGQPLPPVLATMVARGETRPIETLLAQLERCLAAEALEHDLGIDFFAMGPGSQTSTRRLEGLLKKTEPLLIVAMRATNDLARYLDWYEGEDWESRFGQTGFYARVESLQMACELWRAAWWYYRLRLVQQPNRSGAGNGSLACTGKDATAATRAIRAYEALRDLTDRGPLGEATPIARVWAARLARALALQDGAYYEAARSHLAQAKPPASERPFYSGWCLETFRLAHAQAGRDYPLIKRLVQQAARLRVNLAAKHPQEQGSDARQLQLALFEATLLAQQMTVEASPAAMTPIDWLADRRYVQPLLQLHAGGDPQLQRVAAGLIGAKMAAVFEAAYAMENSHLPALMKGWQDTELLLLADYYAGRGCKDAPLRLTVLDYFLAAHSAQDAAYAQGLWLRGDAHYRMGQCIGQKTNEGTAQLAAAAKDWHALAAGFPSWRGLHGATAIEPATRAARLGFALFQRQPSTYSQLAQEVMQTLVGQIKAGKTQGPFAATPAGRRSRYKLALIMEWRKDYAAAAEVFATVEAQDPNQGWARYHECSCRFRATQEADITQKQRRQLYQTLAEAMTTSLPGQGPWHRPASLLLARLYEELGRLDEALASVGQALQEDRRDEKTLALALGLLAREHESLLGLHAAGDAASLVLRLGRSLPVARLAYQTLEPVDGANTSDLQALARRWHLEYLALATTTATATIDNTSPETRKKLLVEAQQVLGDPAIMETCQSQLWYVRCRALVLYAAGEPAKSQRLWQRIRSSAAGPDSDQAYFWWEARYYGLRCLAAMGQTEDARHAADVLVRTRGQAETVWVERIRELTQDR